MKIGGLQKVSLIDYPKEICAIVFTYGCNFRCPYCHNPELVTGTTKFIDVNEVLEFLKSRIGKLSAVSITGGEPTIHNDLPVFIQQIKSMGYKVKLDTNGTNPDMIKWLINERLIDYIAMDIKAPLEKYEEVVRVKLDVGNIFNSIKIIMEGEIDYEFRTTVVKNLISKKDILDIADMIHGAKAYYLQRFVPSKTLDENFLKGSPFSDEEIENIEHTIGKFFDVFSVR